MLQYHCKDFNAKVKHNGKTVRLFTRQTQMNAPNWVWLDIEVDGFEGVRHTSKPKERFEDLNKSSKSGQ